jgi:hypothetical protein
MVVSAQPGQRVPLPPQRQHTGFGRLGEHRQHPQRPRYPGLVPSRADSQVVDERHITQCRQRPAASVRQLQRPQQHFADLRRHHHTHRHRRCRTDRRSDRLAEQDAASPLPRLRNDPRLIGHPPVRCRMPARVPVQVAERRHLTRSRIEVHLVVGQRHASLLIGQQPPPAQRSGDINGLQQ